MFKKVLAASTLSLIAFTASAATSTTPYTLIPELEAKLPKEPTLPAKICATLEAKLIQTNGILPYEIDADPANSKPDSARIQAALDACPAGQAVKLVTQGDKNAFLAGTLDLRSNVKLWVDKGVTVFASRSPVDYHVSTDRKDYGYCGTADASHQSGCLAWITATDTVNSGIVGEGVLDGRGGAMLTSGPKANQVTWWDLSIQSKLKKSPLKQNNPRMIQITGGSGFQLYGVSIINSPKFHVGTSAHDGFVAWGVKIVTPSAAYAQPNYAECPKGTYPVPGEWKVSTCFVPELVKNTDGIDPMNSTNVTIAYSFISTGDDNIATKSGVSGGLNSGEAGGQKSKDHIYAHNRMYYGHGTSIGSELWNGLENVQIWDLVADGQDSLDGDSIGIRIKSDSSRGGIVKNVHYDEVCMRRVKKAMVFDAFYGFDNEGSRRPYFSDIEVKNFHYMNYPGAKTNKSLIKLMGFYGPSKGGEYDYEYPTELTFDNVQFDTLPKLDEQHKEVELTLGATNISKLFVENEEDRVLIVKKPDQTLKPSKCSDAMFVPFPSNLWPR